ncbi:MAG: hypothetical protein KGZ25_11835, partial [Planctomycetes bacterium]|nr:hypothetical protein [Planctomycetota bacterium]
MLDIPYERSATREKKDKIRTLSAVMTFSLFAFLNAFSLHAADAGGEEKLSEVTNAKLAQRCLTALREWRIGDAEGYVEEAKRRDADSELANALSANVAFMEGDYEVSRRHADALEDASASIKDVARILRQLKSLHSSFQRTESDNFEIRWAERPDRIVAEYAPEVLEKALETLCDTLEWKAPERRIVVEIYPDIGSFSTATTLQMDEIETSGAVAICKFNRLMIASPRLYLQGYRWADTLAHELTHYVIIKKTANGIPVWLHEGAAKYCEELWRLPEKDMRLDPLHATLLAEAREDNHYIGFDEMHISLVKLDTQEEVALAYAEVVSFVRFLRELKKKNPLPELLDRVASGAQPREALSAMTGLPWKQLFAKWKNWLANEKLDRIPGLRVLPRKLTKGGDNTEQTGDLSERLPDEAYHFARLGDMLRDEARPGAAAIEYAKATKKTPFISPHL